MPEPASVAIPDPSSFGLVNYIILGVYLVTMFSVGLFFAGRQKTTTDYFLAGRSMPWFVVALSMFASLTSATAYMGIPGLGYSENISLVAGGVIALFVTPFLILFFYPFYHRLKVTTSYEYIHRRYGLAARFAVSGLFILARMGWLSVVIYSPALALSVVTGINLELAILLMGSLAVTYTVLGGLSAVIWTDLLQFTILFGGAIWVGVTLLLNVPDGYAGIMTIAGDTGHLINWKIDIKEMSAIIVAVSFFCQFMQDYGTDQVSVQRLMAINNYKGIAKAVITNSVCDFFIIGLLLFVGLGMFAYFQHFPDRLASGIAGDKVLPYYIIHALPVGISGLLITAIFAAAMSSMDSGINSLATVFVNDFARPLRKEQKSDDHDLKLARLLTFVIGALAMCVALFVVPKIGNILKAATSFISLFSGPILALFLLGILSRRANFRGWSIAALIAVAATCWLQYHVEAHWTYYFPFCFLICFILGYALSILFRTSLAPQELTLWGRKELKHH
jgi:SSS family transporter